MIKKSKGGYETLNHKGTKVLGKHKTKKEAVKQSQAVMISKQKRASGRAKKGR